MAGSSYGGYVGADVARKAAEELAYAVAHSESSLFNEIVDDDDLEELAKEAIFYDSMHSPDELDMGASPSGGSKKSKKQKKRSVACFNTPQHGLTARYQPTTPTLATLTMITPDYRYSARRRRRRAGARLARWGTTR